MKSPEPKVVHDEDLKFKSGLASSGSSTSVVFDGVGNEIIFSILAGAFFGLILGFMVTHALRYCSLLLGRNIGGNSWPIWGAVLGAIICVCWCIADDE